MNPEMFHNTYNARHLNPKEVAERFIYSDNFDKLIQNNHSVILGARGCGKTTLMKMLTLPALAAWKGSRASNIKKHISFYSVYISTDIYWDVKNHTYNSQLERFGNFANIISVFSVNSNVFTSLCETFKNIIEIDLKDVSEQKEMELCKELILCWKLPPTIPKIGFIKEALNKRIDDVNQLIHHVIFNFNSESEIPKYEYFNLSFESSIEYLIPVFERIYGLELKNKKWALCFDELEFAPNWLQQKLFKSLRSRNQKILYKLSASPILTLELEKSLQGEYIPTSGNDYTLIKTWNSKDNEKFSRQIISYLLEKKTGKKDVSSFFGINPIYNKSSDSYSDGSEFQLEMKELVKKDPSFEKFLLSRNVNLDKLVAENKRQKDILFRKIKPIVYYRNFYNESKINNEGDIVIEKRRRKKMGELFAGIEVLCKVCDGNPRWLIGIISEILSKSGDEYADESLQFNELYNAAKRFQNVIANIPIGPNNKETLTGVINKIGMCFQSEVLGSTFKMDPRTTFTVDKNSEHVPDGILKLLEKAVSQGAIILTESKDDTMDFEIRGQRFKLSYLFFVLYKLPLRNYNSIKLSECLGKQIDNINESPNLFNALDNGY